MGIGLALNLYTPSERLVTRTSTQREPCVGIEPTTYSLQNCRTTAVLTRQVKELPSCLGPFLYESSTIYQYSTNTHHQRN